MNINEVLDNSHVAVMQSIDDLPEAVWDMPGVAGEWSAKDTLAHLTSRELLLIDILKTFQGEQPSPYIRRWLEDRASFDAETVQSRAYQTAQLVENEYEDAQLRSSALLTDVVDAQATISWLQPPVSLADFVQSLADHAREHANQLAQFRDKNKNIE